MPAMLQLASDQQGNPSPSSVARSRRPPARPRPKPSTAPPAIPRAAATPQPRLPLVTVTGPSRTAATTSSTGTGTGARIAAPCAPVTAPRTSPHYVASPAAPSRRSPAIPSPRPSSGWRATIAWSSATCERPTTPATARRPSKRRRARTDSLCVCLPSHCRPRGSVTE